VVGFSKSLAAKFIAALGPPGGVEMRALMGMVDLFVVDKKGSRRREDRGMGTSMRTKVERRRMAEGLLAAIERT